MLDGGEGGEGEGVKGRDLKWAQGLPQAVSQMMTWKKNFEPPYYLFRRKGQGIAHAQADANMQLMLI